MKFLLSVVASLVSVAGITQTSRDEEEVKKVVIAFQADFNEGSFKNAANYTTIDWEHINPFGGITKGRDSVLLDVRSVHQTFLKGVTMKIASMTVRFVTPGTAIAVAIHKIDNYTTPDGVRHNNESHTKTYIIIKQKGKWLLTLDQNTIKPPVISNIQ